MARRCEYCGKGPVAGRSYKHKGKPKKEGGIGQHVTRKNPRRFLPNLQPALVLIAGKIKRIRVCTKCIKKGRLIRSGVSLPRALPTPVMSA